MEPSVKVNAADIEIVVQCLPETMPVRGNAMASGDAVFDKEVEDNIIAQMEHNEWVWCTVRVIARWGDFEGDDFLGGCSYKSEADFRESSPYFEDMKWQATKNLEKEMQLAAEKLCAIPAEYADAIIAFADAYAAEVARHYCPPDHAMKTMPFGQQIKVLKAHKQDQIGKSRARLIEAIEKPAGRI